MDTKEIFNSILSIDNAFLFAFLFFWIFHILRRILLWLHFWQLKEYRIDRFLDGIGQNKILLLPKSSSIAFFLAIFYPFFLKINLSFLVGENIFKFFTFLFYAFFGAYSIYSFSKRKWSLPKFTKKTIIILSFIIFLVIFLLLLFKESLFLVLLIFEIIFPLFLSFCVLIFQVPTYFAKRIIFRKARKKREGMKDLIVIGITGSYGKTSTKEFLAKIIGEKYNILKTEGNNNTEIGVAQTILKKLNKKHQVFICEMAAYKKGEIKTICDIAKPQIGILTGISNQHISLFGSLNNIINAKYELIASLPSDGLAIFNGVNKECLKLYQRTSIKKHIYSFSENGSDLFASNINEGDSFLEFDMKAKSKNVKVKLNITGKQYIENFLGATLCALSLKMTLLQIKKEALKIEPESTIMKKIKSKNGVFVIDDSYSQNPDGVYAAINCLKNYSKKKIVIMPCLIELGKSAPSIHKNIGKKIGEVCDLAIITTPYFFRELKLGAKEVGMNEGKILFLKTSTEILKNLEGYFEKENVILLEGRIPEELKKAILKK